MTLPAGTNRPSSPSRTISGRPPASNATTGIPAEKASSTHSRRCVRAGGRDDEHVEVGQESGGIVHPTGEFHASGLALGPNPVSVGSIAPEQDIAAEYEPATRYGGAGQPRGLGEGERPLLGSNARQHAHR